MKSLCCHPPESRLIQLAQKHIFEGHAERLSEGGNVITADNVASGAAPRPRMLDLFSGGGAIPLEALRLGCDVCANELNPVGGRYREMHARYPQRYGAARRDDCRHGREEELEGHSNVGWPRRGGAPLEQHRF